MITSSREELWKQLESLTPTHLAGSWDNVGVLLDSPKVRGRSSDEEVIWLTIDLTEQVFEEALAGGATVIIAYHPFIFGGVKRLTHQTAQGRIALRAVQEGIAIYSPHTALDAVHGGVCDWLAACLATPQADVLPSFTQRSAWGTPLQSYHALEPCPPPEKEPVGVGREMVFAEPVDLDELCKRLSTHLGATLSTQQLDPYLRVALSNRGGYQQPIQRIALCPGAGGSVFEGMGQVDLLVTGELRHHDILAWSQKGTAVILTEHTRCERGYLQYYAKLLRETLNFTVQCSQVDDDPLRLFSPQSS